MPSRRPFSAALVVLAGVVIVGCFTGKRPHFEESSPLTAGTLTGDPAIDPLLTRLDTVTPGPATAAYDALTKYGNTTRGAVVALDGANRSISIGDVRYVQTMAGSYTCSTDVAQPCSDGWDAARIGDTLLTTDFYAGDTAKRLRRDAQAALAPATATDETLAGMPVTCVQLQLPGGTAKYCVLSNGIVALLDDGDVRVALSSYFDSADPTAFATA